ncbi:MAG: site-2 protease family protein [Armatimonadetes bacterium]|nr:site-2 protease family protein [Armatimonadota bacterium]
MAHFVNTVIVFALLLGALVLFHEFGHFSVAKLFRMKVHEFAFGFGPILARLFRRGETQFNIRVVPLGGFVRIAGMEPGEDEVPDGFNSRPIWQRSLVILAGPFMSLVLGYLVFVMMGLVWGIASDKVSTTIGQVSTGTPAAGAGLKPGDTIVAINGRRLSGGDDMLTTIRSSAGKDLTIRIRRDDETRTVRATPKPGTVPGVKGKVGLLGFVPEPVMERVGIIRSVEWGTKQTMRAIGGILGTLFSKKIAQDVGGIVMIGYMTGEMVKEGVFAVFLELALLSVMLGIINLVPWPILDGGHILFLMVEKIRGKKMEPERLYAIQSVGLAVLVFLAVFLVYIDVARIATGSLPR